MDQTPKHGMEFSRGDATLMEMQDASPTLREAGAAESSGAGQVTLREVPSGAEPVDVFGLRTFRGWPVLSQLPTKGAEADIYIVLADDQRCVLKLYRHRLEPKLEVLNRVTELSRKYSRHFVVFKDAGFDEATGRWYELQEYMPLGSLRDVPTATKSGVGFIRTLVRELADAIRCLHENGIVHCDIKPPNVLVRSLDPPDLVLTDFGISSLLASDASNKMTGLKGTPMYWAPEAFSRMIGRPCDWWGLGMIVLELLTGKHPFEGMTDSQIIRKLTIGNVEVPAFLDLGWSLLVKGLLTKNDARRWGYDEVVRWLTGARGIPVHYEEGAGASVSEPPGRIPFHLGETDCFTPEELARALAENPNPWFSGLSFLRGVRRWLESNMMFDEAARLGKDLSHSDPESVFFRFVHAYFKGPFSFMGKTVDADSLRDFLKRAAQSEAGPAELRVIDFMRNGRLLSFYDEYVKISGAARDPFLHNLLLLMEKKELHEQLGYFDAALDPDSYLWPEDVSAAEPVEALAALRKTGAVPLRRGDLEELKKNYILPWELLSMFRSASTYAGGVEMLNLRQAQDLLLVREPGSHFFEENLSLREYDRVARARRFGHTQVMLEKLALLRDDFSRFPEPGNAMLKEMSSYAKSRLSSLAMWKITTADALFISKAGELFAKRRKIVRKRQLRFIESALVGAGAFYVLSAAVAVMAAGFAAGGFFYYLLDRRAVAENTGEILEACGDYRASTAKENDNRGWF